MNCPKCQALVPAGATVCPTCGEALPAAQPAKKKLPIPLIAGGAGALVVIIILIVALAGSGAKAVPGKEYKAFAKEDAKTLYSIVPQLYLDAENEGRDKDDKLEEDDFIKQIDNYIDEKGKDRPDDYKAKCKVISSTKVKKDIVEEFNEWLDKDSEYQDVYDAKEHKITAAYILRVEYTYAYEDFKGESVGTYIVVKEDGKWKDASYISGAFDWYNGKIDESESKDYLKFLGYADSYAAGEIDFD
ncbi:MAG: zinc ribbon domain-containing protein [Clostridia bacterium]|nr:zinc ribbon domain-containing protein [Clostridia bacterium]